MSVISSSLNNSTIIHTVGFYLTGFTSLPFADVYLIFLALLYVVTLLLNIFLIIVIFLEHSLHTPKYIAVANLAVVDLGLSTAMIPEMLKTFLFNDNFVPVDVCLRQMFFCYMFLWLEGFSITVLAYDRLIAICFPLRQHSINTAARMICILTAVWIFCVVFNIYIVTIMSRLSFCESHILYSYFCDYTILRMACNDYTLQWITTAMFSMSNLFGSLSFIIVSYVCILVAVFRMKTVENRKKALATCTEHLILVAVFYVPSLVFFILELLLTESIKDVKTLNLSLAACIPPFINPLVYSLKTKDIKTRAFAILRKIKVGSEVPE